MPSKFDLTLDVEKTDSLVSTPSHTATPFRTPDMTPLKDNSRNDSFASARTTSMTPDSGTVVGATIIVGCKYQVHQTLVELSRDNKIWSSPRNSTCPQTRGSMD